MLEQRHKGIYQSTLLSNIPALQHGFSSRLRGDMRKAEPRKAFLASFGIDQARLITGEQIHGDRVTRVDRSVGGGEIPGADALVTSDTGVVLAVRTADCVPVLLVDPDKKVVAAAHVGWKGALAGLTRTVVTDMLTLGAAKDSILVAIGPHIGMCCYSVSEERARMFLNFFEKDPKVTSFFEGSWHVDIGYVTRKQLVDVGVNSEHIDAPPTCTSCQNNEFFSYRKDSFETFGEMLGLIGYR